ncbi:hypothetical protein TELCIR_17975, partial [Teladorsagia circumcincta]
SSSEDEWEELELVDAREMKLKDVQVTVEDPGERDLKSLWMRREVNKCIREKWENCHRVNVLCYIAHLQYLKNQILDGNFIPSLMLSTASEAPIKIEPIRRDASALFADLVFRKGYERDVDRAVIVLENIAKLKEKYSSLCVTVQMNHKGKGASKKKASTGTDSQIMIRDYWVEYWDRKQKRWICVDPLRATVDEPSTLEENFTKPVTYVLAIDNEGGVRDVTARYAGQFSRSDFRRRRTDPAWLARTLGKKVGPVFP